MALATRRWLTMRFFTVTAAPLNAASVAARSPISHLKATLPGAPSCSLGAPDCAAFSVTVTAASGSQSTRTISAASIAAVWLSAMTTATGSPTCRAASDVSGMWGTIARSWTTPGIFFSFRRSQPQGSELTPVMSLPVKTATTPGCRSAAAVSILRMRAWACGLRTKAAYVMPGSFKSSTYWPRPVMNRGSSRRLIDFPNNRSAATVAMTSTSLLRGHVLGRPLDRLHDVVVTRAPAQVALELVADQLLGRLGVALEHLVDGHDHARRAETALEPVLLPEPLLDRVQLAVLRETLDGQDGRTVGLDREHRARLHRLAAEEDRARAALARVATDVCPGEPDDLPD